MKTDDAKSRILLLITTAVIVIPLCILAAVRAETNKKVLTIFNWAEYLDPEIVKDFELKFNVKVKALFFEDTEDQTQKLLQSNGKGYDVTNVDTNTAAVFAKRGWLEPVNIVKIPNMSHIPPKWSNMNAVSKKYCVPFSWGTTGIIYRKDLVKEKITSWKQLYQPQEYLRGKILMTNEPENLMQYALKALGYSLNSTEEKELAEAEKLVLAQKPYVKTYGTLLGYNDSAIVKGIVYMAYIWNGDALVLQKYNSELKYVLPEEGSEIWIDNWVVLKHSPQTKLGMDFINFLNEPRIAARQAQFSQYATPNKAAEKFLPPEFLNNPIVYPSEEALKNSEYEEPIPPHVRKKYYTVYSKLLR